MQEVREQQAGPRRSRNRSQSDHAVSFPFFFRDWMGDGDVRTLTRVQRDRLMDSLCFTWGTSTVGVATEPQLRAWLGYSEGEWPEHRETFLRIWRRRGDGMLVQRRAQRLRAEQKRRWRTASENGKKGGRKQKGGNGASRVGLDLANPNPEPAARPIPLHTKPENLSLRASSQTPETGPACSRGPVGRRRSARSSGRSPRSTPARVLRSGRMSQRVDLRLVERQRPRPRTARTRT